MLTLRTAPPRLFGWTSARSRPPTDLVGLYFDALWRHWSPQDRAVALALSGAAALGLAVRAPCAGWRHGWDAAEQALIARTADPDAHLAMAVRKGVHRLLNPGAYPLVANPLKNKRLFAGRCREAALPTPETFEGGPDALHMWLHGRAGVIAKPNYASKGAGVIGFQRRSDGWRSGAEPIDEGRVVANLAAVLRDGGLVQEACAAHPALQPLSPGALPTLRVMTAVNEAGEIEACDRVLRLSAGGPRPVDNFNAGNVVASLDAEARIGRGFRRVDGAIVPVERHPATGVPLVGHVAPDIAAAIELATHAHEAFRDGFFVIGWDVGLSDRGPIMIEGNWNPGVDVLQLVSGRGLGDSRLGALYAGRLRDLPAETWRRARPIERDRR
ncbi:sugar-transfer associated ATP-grasp domain-containing protein [Methylopila sp. Yamaguchi]|uniref:sugar-transfer associated ATP-grasp domain-containing protein n=1 Tax=Methylopila sp. Yamaguchi TaxID=1437817 RepID=UPI000CB73A39|nr:sugar-transfer associated ATP-grasp domain-containing protein [Methylopila sp. Yamaguchi]GBD49025.1 hypothetical protein METY_2238 [Methylopila sp. Yamaguchi]